MYSTQQHIPIEEVRDNLVFLKDGGVSLVLVTSAVNFGLLFETEQIAIIDSFAGLLNSLSFPIQVIIRSERLDASTYLQTLDKVIQLQANPQLKNLTVHYRAFVESLIKENEVLDKQFYICISAASIELSILQKSLKERTQKALTILKPRRDHMIRQLARIGLRSRQLDSVELVKLFYDIYNNEPIESLGEAVGAFNQLPPTPVTQSSLRSTSEELHSAISSQPQSNRGQVSDISSQISSVGGQTATHNPYIPDTPTPHIPTSSLTPSLESQALSRHPPFVVEELPEEEEP